MKSLLLYLKRYPNVKLPTPELQDAWNRLLRLDTLVEELRDNIAVYSVAQNAILEMEHALRGEL